VSVLKLSKKDKCQVDRSKLDHAISSNTTWQN